MGSHPAQRRPNVDSVCIIGAGPSGLAAAKYLRAERKFSRITVLEQRGTVGGLWNHVPCSEAIPDGLTVPQTSPHAGVDNPIWRSHGANGVSVGPEEREPAFMTPLYDRLETNIPRGLMGFHDLDWPEDCQLFPQHEQVLRYIERYAADVRDLIHFRRQVLDVRPTAGEQWLVESREVSEDGDGAVAGEIYDAVVVANGHFNVPYIPQVVGIDEWNAAYPGAISHSKFYRTPDPYTGRKVIVVGNSASGVDIGAQIQAVCQPPLLMSQKSDSFLLSDATPSQADKPPIAEYIVADRSVRFEDGTVENGVDAVLYCTGYFYSFPFLRSLRPPLVTTGERTENLYQHIFYRPRPTLAFPVLTQKVIPFPMAEAQSAVIARVFAGRLPLPDDDEMGRWEAEMVREQGAGRDFHLLKFPKDADYINAMHDWSISADGERHGAEADRGRSGHEEQAGRGKSGRPPPYWDEKAYWTRERFPAIKKAFQDFGRDRHKKRTLEDVGFDFGNERR